jgi:glycosyltransferase involved in cell wall biosynthesis
VPNKPLRILINGLHSKSGGGVTYLRNILPALAKEDPGLELHLLIHSKQMPLFDCLADHARLHVLRFDDGILATLLWEQLALPILARVMGAQVVFSPANYGPFLAHNSVLLLRNSLAVAQEDTRFAKRVYWAAVAMMTRLSLLFARRAVAVSRFAIGMLTQFPFGRMDDKIVIIPHGVSAEFVSGEGVPRENFLLAVGDIYIQKNYHTLLSALAELLPRHPGLTLRIAGRELDSEYKLQLDSVIQKFGIEKNVEFLGNLPTAALVDLYRTCRLFVFPSTVETFGNPLLEAMACGAPVACSCSAAMPEVAGDAVEYFSPLSATDLARAVERILNDDDLRISLSERALARAAQFSWSRSASALAQVFRAVGE